MSLRVIRHSPLAAFCPLLIVYCLRAAHCTLHTVAAQSATATLSGTVVDQNGAVVPGAEVQLLNPATAFARQTTTNDSGGYTFPLLPAGTYSVTAQRDGFAPIRVENIVLNVGDQKGLQIQLKAGDVNAEVQVTSEASLIDESPAVGTVVDRQFVENVPLNGRSFQSLIGLTPGVVIVPAGPNNSGQFSVNGQRGTANAFMVDGVSANFATQVGSIGGTSTTGNLPGLTTFGTTQSLVSVDALQEFKVQTSGYSAEYGRQPGGQVSIVTRSGTNDFHGSLFDYLRNDVFDANDWFANANRRPKPPMRQNDFGGTFSGPVLLPRFGEGGRQPGYKGRNRTFFFFSYEGLRLRLPQFSLTNVPTLALRQQSPAGIRPILNAFPLPNGRDLGDGMAEFSASYSDPSSLDATSIRIDHTINSKFTLFGRYNKAPSESTFRDPGFNLGNVQSNKINTQTLTLGVTWLLMPSTTNELRINYSSNNAWATVTQDDFGGAAPPARSTVVPSQYDSSTAQGFIGLNFGSFPTIALGGTRTGQYQFNLVDNFSYTVGAHQFRFGFDYRRLNPIGNVNPYLLSVVFDSSQQVLAATAGSAFISTSLPRRPVIINFSAYTQDKWKLSRRLTFDLGLRWDVNPAPTEANGNDQPAVTQIDNLATMDLAPLGTRAYKTSYSNFGPRIGVAYLLSEEPGRETVLRGGFGAFYDTGNDFGAANFNQGFPFGAIRTIFNVSYPLSPSPDYS
ncbi:MAG TPA: carboxypeptidase regulatory-like domain-containing protein [Pyrinomonadaceae bacterium]|nr:carboxypeptidase regulatory-like domain-containing protein [Pyrinomonadaceae bacterium]